MVGRLPLTDPQRQEDRDNRMWEREQLEAADDETEKMCCPCVDCRGVRPAIQISECNKHLREQGRSPQCRVYRGPDKNNSSDDEWESAWHSSFSSTSTSNARRRNSEINMRAAISDLFQQVDKVIDNEAQLNDVTMCALDQSDLLLRPEDFPIDNNGNDNNDPEASDRLNPPSDNGAHDTHSAEEPSVPHHDKEQSNLDDDRLLDAKALEDSMQFLYTGTTLTKLGACVMILNLKATHSSMTDVLCNDIISTLKELLPCDNVLPGSLYHMRQISSRLGLNFTNIDGCVNGCVLYDLPETKALNSCPCCGHPRFADMARKCRPLKVLRQFHVIPRLQRMYRTPALSKLMRWYKENPSTDGKVRYPADSKAWKRLDNMPQNEFDTQNFGCNIQDVRLQISVDGVNPFKLQRSSWSAWPVVINFLNLPPWLVNKNFFTMLALIIPGKKQVPSQFFDVWIRPLIDELKTLWQGVPAYDILEPVGHRKFLLRAAVLYTTHDYPGYGTIAGASHQGVTSCPPCGQELQGRYSNELKKCVYPAARRWLPVGHIFRSPEFDMLFDGRQETRLAPSARTAAQQQQSVRDYKLWLLRKSRKKRRQQSKRRRRGEQWSTPEPPLPPDPSKITGMKRQSIFFQLPYWEHLAIRHTLDVMHCERNLAENLLKTICGVTSKDDVFVRKDMEAQGIREHLWMIQDPQAGNKQVKPAATYVLTPKEFDKFCSRLESLRVPSGYCSEIGKLIRDRQFSALKSHDYHVLIQNLIPLALRGLMEQKTRLAIMRTCRLFRRLCCRTWNPILADRFRVDVAETLSLLEMAFPPSFVVIMTHLPLHLVEELILLGPVHSRWMYPVEQFLGKLKTYVRNRARPEASIARGYLMEETIGFITSNLDGFNTVSHRIWESNPYDARDFEVLQGTSTNHKLSPKQRDDAHLYVLRNSISIQHYYRLWEKEYERSNGQCGEAVHWIEDAVRQENIDITDPDQRDTYFLSKPPSVMCKSYDRMNAHGNHWRVSDDIGQTLTNYDSGVGVVETNAQSLEALREHVGELEKILVLDYGRLNTPIILFMVQWKKKKDNMKRDTYIRDNDGFLSVNFKFNLPKDEDPFIFPQQCTQVFFSKDDNRTGDWRVVMRKDARSTQQKEDDDDSFIYTDAEARGLAIPEYLSAVDRLPNLAGAILLEDKENELTLTSFADLQKVREITETQISPPNRSRKRKPIS